MKRSAFLLSFVILLFLFIPFHAEASLVNHTPVTRLTNGLKGYWSFDSSTVNTGTIFDQSGNGFNGIVNGIASSTFYNQGIINQGIRLYTIDAQVKIPDVGSGLTPPSTGMTLSFWMKNDDLLADFRVFDKETSDYVIRKNSDIIQFLSDEGCPAFFDTGTTVVPRVWQHFVITAGPSGCVWYVNGTAVNSSAVAYTGGIGGGTELDINSGLSAENANGNLDEVRYYNRVLAPSEIAALYHMGIPSVVNDSHSNRITSGLAGYWTFDGADISNGTILDRSGNNNTGYSNGTATSTLYTPGKIGQAVTFDTIVNKYINAQSASSLSIAGNLTISAWVYPRQIGIIQGIVSKWGSTSGYRLGINASNNLFLQVGNGSVVEVDSTTALAANKWYHVMGTYDGANLSLYINGIKESNQTSLTGALSTNSAEVWIGHGDDDLTATSYPFSGKIDDLRIYSRALSTTEIQSLYTMGSGSVVNKSPNSRSTSGLLGLWSFDGPDLLQNVTDRSGLSNNGFMTGFTSTSTAVTVGKIGQGLNFDGVNDRIVTTSDFISTSAASACFWLKPAAAPTESLITNGKFVVTTNSTNRIAFQSDGATSANSANNALALNQWVFVCATRTSGGTANIYINGALSGSANQSSGTPASGTTNVTIGANNDGTSPSTGVIDNVRIYSRVLSLTEIQQLFKLGM